MIFILEHNIKLQFIIEYGSLWPVTFSMHFKITWKITYNITTISENYIVQNYNLISHDFYLTLQINRKKSRQVDN